MRKGLPIPRTGAHFYDPRNYNLMYVVIQMVLQDWLDKQAGQSRQQQRQQQQALKPLSACTWPVEGSELQLLHQLLLYHMLLSAKQQPLLWHRVAHTEQDRPVPGQHTASMMQWSVPPLSADQQHRGLHAEQDRPVLGQHTANMVPGRTFEKPAPNNGTVYRGQYTGQQLPKHNKM